MKSWKNTVFNVCLALNCLLLLLLIFESRIALPAWLQVIGRTHPLILHFPIVCIILYAITSIFVKRTEQAENSLQIILSLAAITAVLTAIAGLFLSKEDGYDSEALSFHKWSGTMISVLMLGWFYFENKIRHGRILNISISLVAILLVTFAGHQGAGITHGQNFLLAPILPEKKKDPVKLEDAKLFADLVQPILEEKCFTCHNLGKAKGNLVMETEALLLKGGKSGKLWDSAAPDFGLMMQRTHLPVEQKKHMPPQGKPQLTDEEAMIIQRWIASGASFQKKILDLDPKDTLMALSISKFGAGSEASYNFPAAEASVIKSLNTVNRVVHEEALSSPALDVDFFNRQLYQAAQLKELDKVALQVVSLNLAKMPVADDAFDQIAKFPNLHTLNLSFTDVNGSGLAKLKPLQFLSSISLTGTAVTPEQLQQLASFPALKTVYVWSMKFDTIQLIKIVGNHSKIKWESGYQGDSSILRLSAPVVTNKELIFANEANIELKQYIRGAVIRYTTDGTDPDSLKSLIYERPIKVTADMELRAKTFKKGWASSDTLKTKFYKSAIRPDSVAILTRTDYRYTGDSAKALVDRVRGEFNTYVGNWFGFLESPFITELYFNQPTTINKVSIGWLMSPNRAIFPPEAIEIWVGDDNQHLKKISTAHPKQPKKGDWAVVTVYDCGNPTFTAKMIKVVIKNLAHMPVWRDKDRNKSWGFVDEVLLN